MGALLRKAFSERILCSARVAWIAMIVFLFPLLARGEALCSPGLLQNVKAKAAEYFPQRCEKAEEGAGQQKKKDKPSECNKFLQAVNQYIDGMGQVEKSHCATAQKFSDQYTELVNSPKASQDQCVNLINQASAMTDMQSTLQAAIAEKLDDAAKFELKVNKESQRSVIVSVIRATVAKQSSKQSIAGIKLQCAQKGVDLNQIARDQAKAKEETDQALKIMQMGQAGLGALGQAMALMNQAKGNNSNNTGAIPGYDPNLGNNANSGEAAPAPIGIPGPETGNGIGFVAQEDAQNLNQVSPGTQDPGIGPVASIGSGTEGTLPEFSSSETAGNGLGTGSIGGDVASGSPGSSDSSGASKAPGEETAAAPGANGTDRTGGGSGIDNGGGGSATNSTLLGLGSEGSGDLLGGLKNPFENPADLGGAGALPLAGLEPPPADARMLASAQEIDVDLISKDSVFAAVKDCIRRQRERGNTR